LSALQCYVFGVIICGTAEINTDFEINWMSTIMLPAVMNFSLSLSLSSENVTAGVEVSLTSIAFHPRL
jgi:hypothetical protein